MICNAHTYFRGMNECYRVSSNGYFINQFIMGGLITRPLLLLSNPGHHVYLSLETTVSEKSVEIIVKCKMNYY